MRNLNSFIEQFAVTHPLEHRTGKQFDAEFAVYAAVHSITKDELAYWAAQLEVFLHENRTFVLDAERHRLFLKYRPQ